MTKLQEANLQYEPFNTTVGVYSHDTTEADFNFLIPQKIRSTSHFVKIVTKYNFPGLNLKCLTWNDNAVRPMKNRSKWKGVFPKSIKSGSTIEIVYNETGCNERPV